ncbi:CPBP family intramembrane glutamic endopeptidase [Sporosarcina highlanderae]|uniref:CPBP family intramembrane metalloprotease n=1 Tax=Sporosarcina highlanderae TaxID=3035916 RepID=A0ABT8JM38_9BACL|nr:CPBP family intramembrane glutamic endopeptidase [Sporosarcina highlanderae]MDN4606215.1 CPBP family intramembrane metalloprotease [Sporosarcina highlanderae]
MQKWFGAVFPIVSILLLLWIEQGIDVTYGVKTVAKIILLVGIPIMLFRSTNFPFLRFRKADRNSIRNAFIFGIAIMVLIIGAFLVMQRFIDIPALREDLMTSGITPAIFPFIAIYILFGNSIIEEFFFRGLLPDLFGRGAMRFLLPPFFFAIYHIAIFLPWFTLPILLLAIGGLWTGGLIFQIANEKSHTILPSWIIHMFADLGILLVGIYVLYFY